MSEILATQFNQPNNAYPHTNIIIMLSQHKKKRKYLLEMFKKNNDQVDIRIVTTRFTYTSHDKN